MPCGVHLILLLSTLGSFLSCRAVMITLTLNLLPHVPVHVLEVPVASYEYELISKDKSAYIPVLVIEVAA